MTFLNVFKKCELNLQTIGKTMVFILQFTVLSTLSRKFKTKANKFNTTSMFSF